MEFQVSEFYFRLAGLWVLRRDFENLCFILCFNDERIDLLLVVIFSFESFRSFENCLFVDLSSFDLFDR